MPYGKGTYGSKVGRPKKNGTTAKLKAKNPKMPAKVAKAIAKNMKKKWHGSKEGPQKKCQSEDWQT